MSSFNYRYKSTNRPMSYYAFFKGCAASKPTFWLSQFFYTLNT